MKLTNREFYIQDFDDFIHTINSICRFNDNELWYRGQKNSNWRLTPGLYRDAKIYTLDEPGIYPMRFKYPDYKKGLRKFKEIICMRGVDIEKLNYIETLLLSQHFGLITPLLDWTISPLIALYFALENWDSTNNLPVVYILDPGKCNYWVGMSNSSGENIMEAININEYGQNFILNCINNLDGINTYIPISLYSSKDYSFRIIRQYGKFTLHSPLRLNYPWENTTIDKTPLVKKLFINTEEIPKILKTLDNLNINKKSVYGNPKSKLDINTKNICNKIKEDFNKSIYNV